MYVRWKRRPVKGRRRGETDHALDATLVVAERVNGKPRQRFVSHLGRIREAELDKPWARVRFWRDLETRNGYRSSVASPDRRRLDLVDAAVRERIEVALAARVPKPTPEEVEAADAELRALLGGSPPP